MPSPIPPLTAAASAVRPAAAEPERIARPTAPQTTSPAGPAMMETLRSRNRSGVNHPRVCAITGFSHSANDALVSSATQQRKAQLNAGIDGWATAQKADAVRLSQETNDEQLDSELSHLTFSSQAIKAALSVNFPPISSEKFLELPSEWETRTRLSLYGKQLKSIPPEIGDATSLKAVDLSSNYLTRIPAEIGNLSGLTELSLHGNRLTNIPSEIGNLSELAALFLHRNRLTSIPAQIAGLHQLRVLDLSHNQFSTVPRALLELPSNTEISLRGNPLPDAEILAVREAIAQRRAAGQTAPMLILPPLAGMELRHAAANGMNVHEAVLTNAFKKRLDEVARQFPEHLHGSVDAQRVQLLQIEERLTQAITAYAKQHKPEADALDQASAVAALMFQKGQGKSKAYYNDFDRSPGHVLSYAFLALEAQWAKTPEAHQAEAKQNGIARLIQSLQNASSNCDTRLCEEVMQVIGLPLSEHAQSHPEVVTIRPATLSAGQSHEVVFDEAKKVLQQLLSEHANLSDTVPPATWHTTLAEKIQSEHPRVTPEQVQACVQQIESDWPTFHALVVEQRGATP